MNLKAITPETVPSLKGPVISISQKGAVSISQPAQAIMGLKSADHLIFYQSEDDPTTWYVEVTGKGGYKVNERSDGKYKSLYFTSKALCKLILDSMGCTQQSGRMPIGEPVKHGKSTLYTLVTASLNKATV